jgi:hypothetical protein
MSNEVALRRYTHPQSQTLNKLVLQVRVVNLDFEGGKLCWLV